MSLRENQKAKRRARMLEAAQKLITQTGGTDFTMTALAAESEVSAATPFNVFGTKEALLYELLLLSLTQFLARAELLRNDDPIEKVVSAANAAGNVFVENPKQLRPLYRFLLSVTDPASRPLFLSRSREYWRNSLDAAVAKKIVDERQADIIASSLLAHILGLLELWVHHDISDFDFETQLTFGALIHLSPFVRTKPLADIRARIEKAIDSLPRDVKRKEN